MTIDSANTSQLETLARTMGAEILEGNVRYPSRTGGWQVGEVDLGDFLRRYRDQRLMVVLVPVGEPKKETVTCKVCGYIMDQDEKECPRCKLIEEYTTDVERRIRERGKLLEGVE